MGIFSTNRYGSVGTDVVIEAAEGYHGEIGAAIAMIEGYQNDMALFNGIIMTDFQESALIQEGASAEEIYVLQEGALSGAWQKIIEFFKKLGEKIKGIFHAFIAKMDSIFMKDANAFYKKYLKDINQKKSWEGFKCKVKRVKVGPDKVALGFKDGTNPVSTLNLDKNGTQKKLDDWDSEKEYANIVDLYVSGLSGKNIQNSTEFKKEYMEYVFDDEEEKDNWTSSDITDGYIGVFLKDKENLKQIERDNKATEKAIKNIISCIEKEKDRVAKIDRSEYEKKGSTIDQINRSTKFGSDDDFQEKNGNPEQVGRTKGQLDDYAVKVNFTHKKALTIQEVFTAYASTSIEAYKECCAQARRVYAAAVAFSPKNENAELAAAIGDVAYYEAVDLMDTMYSIDD